MTPLRNFAVRTGAAAQQCRGCDAVIPPDSPAVLRKDNALFCTVWCCLAHDDAPIRPAQPIHQCVEVAA